MLFSDVCSVDAFGTQEVIMQRLKRSDAEVKDGAEVEVASTGWQLLYMGMPILGILHSVFVCLHCCIACCRTGCDARGGHARGPRGEWCDNPFLYLLSYLNYFIFICSVPPMLVLQLISGIFDNDLIG